MRGGEVAASLEPNLSSTLASIQQQVVTASDLSFLRMTICDTATLSSSVSEASLAHNLANHLPTASSHHLQVVSPNEQINEQIRSLPLTKLMLDYVLEPIQLVDNKLDYYFSEIWKNGDERTSKLPFMSGGPWKLIYATLIYLYLIKWLLPKLMQPLRALELNWCIRSYNLLMVLSNMYAFYHGARILQMGTKCFGCEIIKHQDYSPKAMELLHYGWLFFLSRLIEWLDTIFFVLRKKERQVTKLHVFHHSFVPMICWTYLKFHPGYTVAFFPFVNTFVHTIMYTYYFLATFGPNIQPYLWWKKYLTSLQIAQFVLILIQLATIPLSSDEKCQYPRGFLYVAFAGAILFLWLFYTYYIDTYKSTPSKAQAKSSGLVVNNHNNQSIKRNSTGEREGSSRSLSDAIDNAIDSSVPDYDVHQSTPILAAFKKNHQQNIKLD